jgi:homoserine kinase
MDKIKVFSPGSITNLSCGYDILGVCLNNRGDEITVTKTENKGIIIKSNDNYNISNDINKNVAGIAAQALLKKTSTEFGFEIEIKKGIKPGSGIGSSAASSAGTVFAINQLLDSPISQLDLIKFSMEGEKFVSDSYHADNVAPIIFGGITLVRSINEIDVIKLPTPKSLEVIIIRPNIEIKTSDSRKVLRKKIKIEEMVQQSANLGSFVSSLYNEDFNLMSRSIVDIIAEPNRRILIPEFDNIIKLSKINGAIAAGISGSGPSIFSLSKDTNISEKILKATTDHYNKLGISYDGFISKINTTGIKILESN